MITYTWDIPKLSVVKMVGGRKKNNYNQVKEVLDSVKLLMKKENDPVNRKDLADAGLSLNRILLR